MGCGWTALSEYGIFGDLDVSIPGAEIVIKDADLEGGRAVYMDSQ